MADKFDEISFDRMKLVELKGYLRIHGQLYSGTKKDLVRRAKGTYQLLKQRTGDGEDITDSNEEETVPEYRSVAALVDWVCVDAVQLEDWPELTDKQLYDYLVYTCQKTFDLKPKNARRQTKANIFYEDGHVHSVNYHPVPDHGDECYIKCLVIPSAASSDKVKYPDRNVWVRLSKVTARVNSAYCTCTAGIEGSCNHVAALLYAMVDITAHKKEGLDASTSNTCKWKMPRKRKLSPKKSCDLVSTKCKKLSTRNTPQTGVNILSFTERLKTCAPKSGWLVNFTASKTSVSEIPLPPLPAPSFMFADFVDISAQMYVFDDFASSQSCSEADRFRIEQATREQNRSALWHNTRKGKLTSSHFGQVCKRRPTTAPENLVKVIMKYGNNIETEHMRWGINHEAAAKRSYLTTMKKSHPGISIRKAGLILDGDHPYLASSPDAFIHCPHCSPTQGVLEVKCPSASRDKTPEDACRDKKFFCELVDGKVMLRRNHDYYYQVQGQMAITGRKWCNFVVWTPKGIAVECIKFDPEFWKEMLTSLSAFYVKCVVPEIFTERVKRGLSLFQTNTQKIKPNDCELEP